MKPFKRLALVAALLLTAGSAMAGEAAHAAGGDMTHKMTVLMLQLAAIICAAKIGGFVCQRFLKIPDVLGELGAGILIGPYALGPVLHLFSPPAAGGAMPISPELYGIATLASIILLYLAGLETDLAMFLKYSVAGSMVGIGGIVVSFVLGDLAAVWFFEGVNDFMHPAALFLGTISTATSVGITARILSERKKLDSPEGVTILAGAVIDDVGGIIILAVVIGMAKVAKAGGSVHWGEIGWIAIKALGFWLGCTALGLALAKRIGKVLEIFGSREVMAALSLGLALLLAGLSEKAGLAMIIGAYIMGLSLSRIDCARELQHRLEPVYQVLVSIFFCVMGMLVDLSAIKSIAIFGLIYSVFAIFAKVVGCAIPAMFMKFNKLGAFRIGIGMLPRGEVALIVAGIGLSTGAVNSDVFGVAIMMTLITTVVAPLIMVKIFDDRPGCKIKVTGTKQKPLQLTLPNREAADFVMSRIVSTFRAEECYVQQLAPGEPIYQVRKDDIAITVQRQKSNIELSCNSIDREYARLVLMEAVAELITVLEGLRKMGETDTFRAQVMA